MSEETTTVEQVTGEHTELPWIVTWDKYPPTVKRILLVGKREGCDYVIAAESMPERRKDAKRDYEFIRKAVTRYDSLRSRVTELEAQWQAHLDAEISNETEIQRISREVAAEILEEEDELTTLRQRVTELEAAIEAKATWSAVQAGDARDEWRSFLWPEARAALEK